MIMVNLDTGDVNARRKGALVVLAALASCSAAPAGAQPNAPRDWQFELTPYLWATAMKGEVRAGDLPRTSVDMSFGDILDKLDMGAMAAFEARKGRWGFLFNAIYMKVSEDATATRTSPGPIGATLTARADLEVKQTLIGAAVAHRISDGPSAIDVLGGARYVKIKASADLDASLFALTGTVSRSADKDWVDPFVGIRLRRQINERWAVAGYLDAGGFGISSDLTWQVMLGGEYAFSKTTSLKFGYRQISFDYDQSGFVYDMKDRGAYVGIGIRF